MSGRQKYLRGVIFFFSFRNILEIVEAYVYVNRSCDGGATGAAPGGCFQFLEICWVKRKCV